MIRGKKKEENVKGRKIDVKQVPVPNLANAKGVKISVVDPKLFFLDPDPALGLISDPDSDPDPACLTEVIRLYKIKL